jgi:hypothetical protein
MGIRATVDASALNAALRRVVESGLPVAADTIARKILFDVAAETAETVPVDTGRYRAAWLVGADLSQVGEGEAEDASLVREESGGKVGYTLTNRVEYGPEIEFGNSKRPPGNHLTLAIINVGRAIEVETEALEAIREAWDR